MPLVWIHQKLAAIIIDGKAEMIGHGFVQIVFHCPPKSTCQINTFLIMIDIGAVAHNCRNAHPEPPLKVAMDKSSGKAMKPTP